MEPVYKSELNHTALYCKDWYRGIEPDDTNEDFIKNLWKNMAHFLSADCLYKFESKRQVADKLVYHITAHPEFKTTTNRVGRADWLFDEIQREMGLWKQHYADIDYIDATIYVCFSVLQCSPVQVFESNKLTVDYEKFEPSATVIRSYVTDEDWRNEHHELLKDFIEYGEVDKVFKPTNKKNLFVENMLRNIKTEE
jgi:phosphopantetheine adenylyltransferase